jgi:type I restriction enzyme S subunit
MGKRKGAAYVGINIEDIRRLPIYLPPRKEQERVSDVLSEAHGHTVELQNIYEKKIQKLLDLKSSLLSQAFAGELTA